MKAEETHAVVARAGDRVDRPAQLSRGRGGVHERLCGTRTHTHTQNQIHVSHTELEQPEPQKNVNKPAPELRTMSDVDVLPRKMFLWSRQWNMYRQMLLFWCFYFSFLCCC